jgi:uncharacterized membrane protein
MVIPLLLLCVSYRIIKFAEKSMLEDFEILDGMGGMILLIIVLLTLWLLLKKMGKRNKRQFRSPSLNHLRTRYLKGEIDEDEYEKQKNEIKDRKENQS